MLRGYASGVTKLSTRIHSVVGLSNRKVSNVSFGASLLFGSLGTVGAVTCYSQMVHAEAMSSTETSTIVDSWAHTKLYPPITAYKTGELKVSDIHTIHYEIYGNPNGKPVLFVHGGPGGGTKPVMARYFDPAEYKIILVDQRGCGQSTPFAELRDNTTYDSVRDFEKLRNHLGIEKWQVFGGSWGSTLGLAYAVSY